MRPGLILAGVVLAVVGVAVLMVGFSTTGTTTTHSIDARFTAPGLEPGVNQVGLIPSIASGLANSSTGSLTFNWVAGGPINVSLYQAAPCKSPARACPVGNPLDVWTLKSIGVWNSSGAVSFPYLLEISNPRVTNTTFLGVLNEVYTTMTSAPAWEYAASFAGGGLLVGIGAVSLFLGLFLRGGVYTEPESVGPRYAHELDRPGDESFDGPDDPDLDDPDH